MVAGMALSDPELGRSLELVFGTSPDAVAVVDGAAIVYVNPACRALYGLETATKTLLGRSVLDLITPEAQHMMIEVMRRHALEEPVPASFRTTCVRLDGTPFDAELSSTRFTSGAARYVVLFHRGLDAAPLEDQRSDEALYRAVFDVNTAIKLLIDPKSGVIVDANQPAVEFYGWSLAELRGMRITDINQLSPDEVRAEMAKAQTGRRRYFRFRHMTSSGNVRHVEVHSGPVTIGERQLLLSIIHDVTERDALAEQLRASRELEAVGRLAGGVAHEFNNLLTVVLNGSAMLLRRMPEDSPLRRYVEDVSFASDRAAELTRDLLAFSRRQVLLPRSLDLNGVVRQMSQLLQRSLGTTVSINTRLARELPPTHIDPRQLEHVLMNLVLNAKDAMPGGGEILICTEVVELSLPLGPSGRWVALTVRDEGTGMDAETKRRLFEPFFTTKGKASGTGLGMATVYGIVAQSEGHIQVASELGQGTEIRVLLPIAAATEASEVAPAASKPRPTPTLSILLVDDVDAVRTSLARGLELLGIHVIEAASAEDAISVWRHRRGAVEALVTDIVMPGASGIELALQLLEEEPSLPVIVISGDLRGHDLTRLPASAVRLQKPVTAEHIAREIGNLLATDEGPHPAAR